MAMAAILDALPAHVADVARELLLAGATLRHAYVVLQAERSRCADAVAAASRDHRSAWEAASVAALDALLSSSAHEQPAAASRLISSWRMPPCDLLPTAASLQAEVEHAAALSSFSSIHSRIQAVSPTPLPWQLLYCGERDPDAVDAPVEFAGGRLVNERGVAVLEDCCGACGMIIQDGMLFGVGTPRVHCLDCSDATLCVFCHEQLTRGVDVAAGVVQLHGHVGHRCCVEANQQVLLRESVFASHCLQSVIVAMFNAFAARPCVAVVTRDLRVEYDTFQDEWARVLLLTRALGAITVPGERVCISFAGSRLWYNLELATLLRACVSAGIPDTWPPSDWIACAARACVAVAFVDTNVLQRVCGGDVASLRAAVPSLRHVIIIDPHVHTVHDLHSVLGSATVEAAEAIDFQHFLSLHARVREDVAVVTGLASDEAVILHSSGTTGTPKGIIATAGQCLLDFDVASFERPHVELSYLPPCWGTDKLTVWRTFANGGCVAFASTRDAPLFEFTRVVSPSHLVIVPALAQALRSEFLAAYDAALEERGAGASDALGARAAAHALAAAATARLLGTRCRQLGIGGARVPPLLLEFLRAVLPLVVLEAYGTSESAGIACNNRVVAHVEVKLLDRPDLGFTSHDVPLPRGEVCVRSRNQVQPDKWLCSDAERTAVVERYLPDGFFRTGDIGMLSPTGELSIIDRATALVKLANGQFLSPEKVESVFVDAAAEAGVLIAVTPNDAGTEVVCIASPATEGAALACDLLTVIRRCAVHAGLAPHEVPSRIVVDEQVWTPSNGCLLHNFKLNRRVIRARHAAALSATVAVPALQNTLTEGVALSVQQRVRDAISAALADCADYGLDVPLHDQGADSLSLLQLIETLHQVACAMVDQQLLVRAPPRLSLAAAARSTPATLLARLTPLATSSTVAMRTDAIIAVKDAAPELTFATPALSSVPTRTLAAINASTVVSDDSIQRDLDAAVTRVCIRMQTADNCSGAKRGILITGATGFFGRWLTSHLLRDTRNDEPVIALVRSVDNADAARRMHAALDVTDCTASERARLQCIRGDVQQVHMGLSEAVAVALAARVRVIVHAAAAVKFLDVAAGLPLLWPTNVDGTAHVLQCMAACNPPPLLVHVSTLSAATPKLLDESGMIVALQEGADAYSTTKACAEALVRRVGRRMTRAPIIVRLPLLTWAATGAVNADDWLVRLLHTCQHMRVCPAADPVSAWTSNISYFPVDVFATRFATLLHVADAPFSANNDVTTVTAVDRQQALRVRDVLRAAGADRWTQVSDAAWLYGVRQEPKLPFAPLVASFSAAAARPAPAASPQEASASAALFSMDDAAFTGVDAWRNGLMAALRPPMR